VDLDFATLTVIPAYRDSRPDYLTYNGGYYGRVIEVAKQKSLEVRLSSNGDGPLQYVVGGYYFDEDQNSFNHFVQGSVLSTKFSVDLNNRSAALFGQATYELTPGFRVLGGIRYSHERKRQATDLTQTGIFAGTPVDPFNNTVPPVRVSGKATFEKVTWKAGIEWDAGDRNLIYANVATGFKSGGFFVAALDNTFEPENLTAYTFGSKNRFLDNRLQLNLEAFYWDYKDQQINYIGPVRNLNAAGQVVVGSALTTTNAGKSRIYGAEVELSFQLTPDDLLTANVQYLDAKYTNFTYLAASASPTPPRTACSTTATVVPGFTLPPPGTTFLVDCSGRPQINTPKWSLNLGYERTFELSSSLELLFGARTRIESGRFLSPEYLPEERQDGYMQSDLFLTLKSDRRWSVTAYVNNLEDETVYAGSSLRPVFPVVFNILRAPRTYGLRAAVEF
jgi:iron complex outermembrane receptor protein